MNSVFIQDLLGLVFSFAYVFLFIGIAGYLERRRILGASMTRKLVHIGVSHWWLFAMLWIKSPLVVSIGPAVFILLNWLSLRLNLFKGMEGNPSSRNYGTVYFPVSLLILVLLSWNGLFPRWMAGAGILIMGWGDGLAAIVGESVKSPWGTVFGSRKSMAGTLTMFVASFFVVFILSLTFDSPSGVWIALYRAGGTALIGAFLEVSTPLGIDNITVPLGTAFYLAFATPGTVNALVLIGFLFTIPVAFASWNLKKVTTEGALAGVGVGTALFVFAGLGPLVILFSFFLSSVLIGRVKKEKRKSLRLSSLIEKGDRRDSIQVLANCGVAVVASVLFAATGQGMFFIALVVAFSAATADTWAGEIGVLHTQKPRHILSRKFVEPGVSGGVTVLGFLFSLLGALFVAILFSAQGLYLQLQELFPSNPFLQVPFRSQTIHWFSPWAFGLIIVGGFLGSLFDSLLGATLQAQYLCATTGRVTERPVTNDVPNLLIRGIHWVNNDMVNFLATLIPSVLMGSLYLLRSGF